MQLKGYFVPNLPPFLAQFNQNYKKKMPKHLEQVINSALDFFTSILRLLNHMTLIHFVCSFYRNTSVLSVLNYTS